MSVAIATPCFSCMRFHEPPIPCGFDATKACLSCGGLLGYRWSGPDGERLGKLIECWKCWWAAQPVGSVR